MARSYELFELKYDGDIVYQGEQLYDQKAIHEINKIEKNLWSIMVLDDVFYEVELFSPYTQRAKSSCECTQFREEKACKHITAALFALRSKLKIEAERKAAKAKMKAVTPKKLNINTLLQELNNDDLVNFIKGYARKDKNFNIALKAHFARKVDLDDNKAKYKSILDSVIRPITSVTQRAKAVDLKNFVHISKEFISQLEDAISLSDYTDAYHIIDAGISKTEYVRYHYDNYVDELNQISKRYHELLILLYQRVHAEALKSKIRALIEDLPTRSYYRHLVLTDHIYYHLLKREYKDKVLLKDIEHSCRDVLQQKRLNDVERVTILSLLILLDYHVYKLKDIHWFISTHSRLSMNVVDRLVAAEEANTAVQLMKKMKAHFPKSRELKRKLLQVHLSLRQIKEMCKLLPKYVIQSDDIAMLYKLQPHVPEEGWQAVIAPIIKHYEGATKKGDVLANIYYQEGLLDDLVDHLMEMKDLDELMNYDHALYRSHYDHVHEAYRLALSEILDSYLGDRAQVAVRKALTHLERLGARKLHRTIYKFLESEYKHRLTYIFN